MTERIDGLYKRLIAGGIAPERLLIDEPMSRHTTFRVGGPADIMLCPANGGEIVLALSAAAELGIPAMVMGNGSNMLVRDGGIEGLVVRCLMSKLCAECTRHGLTGFEALGGIPGSVGGASAMNAGAYGSEFRDVLVSAKVIMDGCERELSLEELDMGYRTSRVLREKLIVTEVELELKQSDVESVRALADDYAARRKAKQPLSMPSAGSTFKRPQGYFAGALIEGCGLKGTRVGGAQVSWMHAGFVVNADNASARDVLDLIDLIKTKVRLSAGVELEPEVRVLGRER